MKFFQLTALYSILAIAIISSWSGTSLARDRSVNPRGLRFEGNHEVVSGTYYCSGSIFTDEQPASISVGIYLGATSNLTSGYFTPSRRSHDVPADLGAMSEICRTHLELARSEMPSICVLGVNENEGGEFGNGASINFSFQFSCQGTRDEVIGVIGRLGELVVGSIPPSGRRLTAVTSAACRARSGARHIADR